MLGGGVNGVGGLRGSGGLGGLQGWSGRRRTAVVLRQAGYGNPMNGFTTRTVPYSRSC